MIRRQKLFKYGASPSLSIDCIGADRATPRSARFNGVGEGVTGGGERSVRCVSGSGVVGTGTETVSGEEGAGEPLTPHDMLVGQTVFLLKHPMVVCGWDETAHVWWESTTGEG